MDRALQAQPPPQHAPVNLLQIGNPIENLGSLERGAQAREPRPLQAPPPLSAALLPPPRAQQAGLGELRRPKAARPGRMLSWRARSWPRVDFVAPDFSRNSVDRKREPGYPGRLHLDWGVPRLHSLVAEGPGQREWTRGAWACRRPQSGSVVSVPLVRLEGEGEAAGASQGSPARSRS